MNLLLLDSMQSGLDFALRCMRAGHHVRLCIGRDRKTGLRSAVGDGLVEKIEREEWPASMSWADLVVLTDNTRWLREVDVYRAKGFPIFGPSAESASLELVRSKGQAFLAAHGCDVMPYEAFSDFRRAEQLVMQTPKRYVAKPDGDKDKALSYVSKSAADMVYTLRRWNDDPKITPGRFMLQEFVSGAEFAVNGWLGSNGFSDFIEESFEHKKLMPGDFGPNTGEMGSAIKYVRKRDSALAKEVLLPLERDLIRMGHTGSIDVSVIVDEKGRPRPLEFTSRLGWPAFNIAQALHPEPVQWMVDLLDDVDSFRPRQDHAIGVVMAIPPFPYDQFEQRRDVTGVPVYGFDPSNPWFEQISACGLMDGLAPTMVEGRIVDARCLVSCGDYLAVATGLGSSVRQAALQAYQVVASMEVPNNLIVRNDIGQKCKDGIAQLQDYGFATEWKWS